MGNPYTEVAVVSYNANPPADDGSEVASNKVSWATQKTKLTDPLKVAIDAVDDAVNAAFAKIMGGAAITNSAISYQILAADQGKLVRGTGSGITFTTPDATSVGAPFVFGVRNAHASGLLTLDGSGAQTIDGVASFILAPGQSVLLFTDGSNWFSLGADFISLLAEDTSPDASADYVATYDASATAHKKVLLANLPGRLPRGYIDGCTLANGTDATNDINIAAGVCRDSTNAVDITVPAISGKQLDANWAAGDSAGMRNSAAGIANTTYHLYAVRTAASATADIYAHTSTTVATVLTALQAETGGASYAYARRIGSIIRSGGAILGFIQSNDYFGLKTSTEDVNNTGDHSSAQTGTLTVPDGIRVRADLRVGCQIPSGGNNAGVLVTDLSAIDSTPSATATPGLTTPTLPGASSYAWTGAQVHTSTSKTVRYRSTGSTVDSIIVTRGWFDSRGKDD